MKTRDKKKKRLSTRQRAESHNIGFESGALLIPKGLETIKIKADCKVMWSIVPYEATKANPLAFKHGKVGELWPERTYYTHPNIGPDNISVACPAHNTKHLPSKRRLKCPICDYRGKLGKDPDHDPEEMASLRTKERQLWLIYDHEAPEKGVQLYDCSFHSIGKELDEAVRSDMADDDPVGYEFFADPEDGFILKISFKEQAAGGTGKWFPPARLDFKPRKKPLPDEVVEHGIDVDSLVKFLSYEELKDLFLQSGPQKDEKKKKGRHDDDDEDEEEDDEDLDEDAEETEDEDDDEDEPPRKSSKKKKRRKEVDDEDDDDDEETTPRRKRRR